MSLGIDTFTGEYPGGSSGDITDMSGRTSRQLSGDLTLVQAALDAVPDVVTTRDGLTTVAVTVLDLLDLEQQIQSELHRRRLVPVPLAG